MKKTVTLFIHQVVSGYLKGDVTVCDFDCSTFSEDTVVIGTQVIEIDVPEVDINAIMVTKLRGQIQAVRAKSEAEVTQLQGRIQELLAIGVEQ